MLVSYSWLQDYFDKKLPKPEELEKELTFHAFEVEGIEEKNGDYVLDVDVLPNRAHDALSHRGIAKEISVILSLPLKHDPLREKLLELQKSNALSVIIDNTTLCRRFTGAVIKGVNVGPSPSWLVERLETLGQKSINNIVDAANYVMFDLGQPLHAFDAGKFKQEGGKWKITVRVGKPDEKIVTLDGEEYAVGEETLLITDGYADKPIGIAGVKGGKAAEVAESTVDIIIESANFHPVSVRKTSQSLKLRTDASTRFENEPSPDLALYGLSAAVKLIQEIAGGEVEGYADEYPRPRKSPYKVGITLVEINTLLGSNAKDKDVHNILDRFEFAYEKVKPISYVLKKAPGLVGKPYEYGASISYRAPEAFDCSSFVGYLFANGGVSIPRMAIDQYLFGTDVSKDALAPGDVVFSRNSNPKDYTFTRLSDGAKIKHIGAKDISEEFLPGTRVEGGISHNGIYLGDGKIIHAAPDVGVVIEELSNANKFKNIVGYRRMVKDEEHYVVTVPFERMDLRLPEDLIEEVGRVYGYENIKTEILPKLKNPLEVNKTFFYAEKVRNTLIGLGFSEVSTYTLKDKGEVEITNPVATDKNFLRNNLSDSLQESLGYNSRYIELLGVDDIRIFEFSKVFTKNREYLAFALAVKVRGNGAEKKEQKIMQETLAEVSKALGVEITKVLERGVVEFDFGKLIENLSESKSYEQFEKPESDVTYKPISQYPFVLRDIAVWVSKEVTAEQLQVQLEEAAGALLVRSTLFDQYRKDDKVSYAYRLVFQSREKTLSDEVANKVMEKIINTLEDNGWEVR